MRNGDRTDKRKGRGESQVNETRPRDETRGTICKYARKRTGRWQKRRKIMLQEDVTLGMGAVLVPGVNNM